MSCIRTISVRWLSVWRHELDNGFFALNWFKRVTALVGLLLVFSVIITKDGRSSWWYLLKAAVRRCSVEYCLLKDTAIEILLWWWTRQIWRSSVHQASVYQNKLSIEALPDSMHSLSMMSKTRGFDLEASCIEVKLFCSKPYHNNGRLFSYDFIRFVEP